MLLQLIALGALLLWAYLSCNSKCFLNDEAPMAGTFPLTAPGEEGERRISGDLHRHLARLCGDDWLVFDSLILIHAPGSAFPTAEIDHLVITPFGIFVIETKHWAGAVTPDESGDMLMLAAIDGQRLARTSPMKQNAAKVRFLRGLLPPRLWIVEGLGVFSHEAGTVDPTLPAALLERGELYRHLRICQQRFAHTGTGRLPVRTVADAILRHADMRPQALVEHRQRIQEGRTRGQG